jgi:hypothetical protein
MAGEERLMSDIVERLLAPEFADVAEKYLMVEAAHEIERLRTALTHCAVDWISAPGTVMEAASMLSAEFRRRMEIADAALTNKPPPLTPND